MTDGVGPLFFLNAFMSSGVEGQAPPGSKGDGGQDTAEAFYHSELKTWTRPFLLLQTPPPPEEMLPALPSHLL